MIAEFSTITGVSYEVKQPKLFLGAPENRVVSPVCPEWVFPKNSVEQNHRQWYLSYGLGHGELQEALTRRPETGGIG